MFCAIVLALLTGLVAGQLSAPRWPDLGLPPTLPSAESALPATDYYDAVNRYLKGEGPERLEALVRPDYIGHPIENGAGESRAALLARLDGLKRTFPHLQLQSEVISVDSRLVVVRVAIAGASGGVLAGIPVEIAETPSELEVLRFDGDTLAERWSYLQWPATIEVQGKTEFTTADASPLQPRLERITLEAGEQLLLPDRTAFLIATEKGELAVVGQERPGMPAMEQLADAMVPLVIDELVVLPEGQLALAARYGPYSIRAQGGRPATFLLFRIENFVRESQLASMPSQGLPSNRLGPEGLPLARSSPSSGFLANELTAERITLATSLEIESDEQPWVITVGRVTLASGATLEPHQVEGVEILVVESGELRVKGSACTSRCIATAEESSQFVSGEFQLRESAGFSATQGATVAYGASKTGPATFLMITIARPRSERPYL